MAFTDRLIGAWNAFLNRDPTSSDVRQYETGYSYGYRPDRIRFTRGNERSIITSVYNRIATDCAAIKIEHVRIDENDRYLESIDSGLNYCLTTDANIDQTGRAFIQDIVESMLDEGVVAIVPTDTTTDPRFSNSFDIRTMRTGKIVQWYPQAVTVRVYNERSGQKEDITMPKSSVGIIENPFYAIMNESNSTMQRLVQKLALLDVTDEQQNSSKMNLIIQLPYVVKTKARETQAENRRKDIEKQLTENKYGIAYTDGTEKITQLNRPIENKLQEEIAYLTEQLYSQLGMSQAVLNGSAPEEEMLNYTTRTIEPILSTITDEMKRKFLSKTARSQLQSIMYFRDPFRLVPVSSIAEIADKFTRNEIMTSNEIRQIVGMKPSKDPEADELRNKNLSQPTENAEPKANKLAAARQTVNETRKTQSR